MAGFSDTDFDITRVIDKNLIALNLEAKDKEDMLRQLISLLDEHGRLNNPEEFYADVLWREKEGQTGIGLGVAIPHGKSSSVNQTSLAIGTTANPIVWESIDDKPVSIVILFAVTQADSDTVQLKLLQHVAKLLVYESFIEKLYAVKTANEMLELLQSNPDDYSD